LVIYFIKNKINGKGYVGQHCGQSDARWRQHLREALQVENPKPLYAAIRKYGKENFSYEVLEEIPIELGQRELDTREIFWIHNKNTFIKNGKGYNLTLGGGGGVRQFCSVKGEGQARHKWGQYDLNGNFIDSWNSPTQAARILGCNNYRHLYHAANWHENKGKYGKTFCGFMWKKVPLSENLPTKITPLNELTKIDLPKLRKIKIPKSSTSEEFEIGQYNFLGELVNVWPNNGEIIGRTLKMEGDSIRRNLRGESVLTYGFMWRRFRRGESPKKIPAPQEITQGLSLDENLFYDEPILKINLLDKDIMNKYTSISEIPVAFLTQLEIYDEAVNMNNVDNTLWIFEKDYEEINNS
jgi:group I intron endonuclease